VRHADKVWAAAGLDEGIVTLGVGGGLGHFAHAGLHVNQHDGVAGSGLVGVLSVTVPVTVAACARALRRKDNASVPRVVRVEVILILDGVCVWSEG